MASPLQTLLRLRQYEVDRCQTQLASAVLHEQSLAERLKEVGQQQDLQRAELATVTQASLLSIDAWRLRQRHLEFLTDEKTALQARFDEAQMATRQHRAALVAADQQRQVVEKLNQRQTQAAQVQIQRAAARELEEAWQAKS